MASFGENLRRERELRGIDLREMAEATKISIRFLQALEQDRVDILPGGIFPRAFVRQYAKYLGLDPDRLVAEFVYAHGAAGQPFRGRASRHHLCPGSRVSSAFGDGREPGPGGPRGPGGDGARAA